MNDTLLCVYKEWLKFDTNGNSIYMYIFSNGLTTLKLINKNDYSLNSTYDFLNWCYTGKGKKIKYDNIIKSNHMLTIKEVF